MDGTAVIRFPPQQSMKSARKVVDEIAASGGFTADHIQDGSVVYTKLEGRYRITLAIEKEGERKYTVVKSTEEVL